eukprot:jgi/Undpi1/290/HiC_scaffold_1.g00286.m1
MRMPQQQAHSLKGSNGEGHAEANDTTRVSNIGAPIDNVLKTRKEDSSTGSTDDMCSSSSKSDGAASPGNTDTKGFASRGDDDAISRKGGSNGTVSNNRNRNSSGSSASINNASKKSVSKVKNSGVSTEDVDNAMSTDDVDTSGIGSCGDFDFNAKSAKEEQDGAAVEERPQAGSDLERQMIEELPHTEAVPESIAEFKREDSLVGEQPGVHGSVSEYERMKTLMGPMFPRRNEEVQAAAAAAATAANEYGADGSDMGNANKSKDKKMKKKMNSKKKRKGGNGKHNRSSKTKKDSNKNNSNKGEETGGQAARDGWTRRGVWWWNFIVTQIIVNIYAFAIWKAGSRSVRTAAATTTPTPTTAAAATTTTSNNDYDCDNYGVTSTPPNREGTGEESLQPSRGLQQICQRRQRLRIRWDALETNFEETLDAPWV